MYDTIVKNNISSKCDFTIKILSIISLICTAFSCVSYFFYYNRYELSFSFPNFISLISLILTMLPVIFFILYIHKFYNKFKSSILVPIIFTLFPLGILCKFIDSLNTFYTEMPYVRWLKFLIIYAFGFVFVVCIFGLLIISAFKNFTNKILFVIGMSGWLLVQIVSLIRTISNIEYYITNSQYHFIFSSSVNYIGITLLYIALFLFGLNNKTASFNSILHLNEKTHLGKNDPEIALKLLKEKLELDIISEDEYQVQRAEIIRKL